MEGLNPNSQELEIARKVLTNKYSKEFNIPIEDAQTKFDELLKTPINDFSSSTLSFSEDFKKAINVESDIVDMQVPSSELVAVEELNSNVVENDSSLAVVTQEQSSDLVVPTEKSELTSTALVVADNETTEKKEPTTDLVVAEVPQPKQASTDLVVAKEQKEQNEQKEQKEESDVERKIQELFNAVDKNKNKKIQRTEFLIAIRRKNKNISEIFGLPNKIKQEDGTRDQFEKIFQAIDTDDDGEITFEELKKYILDEKNKVKMEKMTAGRRKTKKKRKRRKKVTLKKRKTRRKKKKKKRKTRRKN
tara:strand:- start:2227 stop:3141 length:915 start_codon:yes stop_codon:yes gene_type:complete